MKIHELSIAASAEAGDAVVRQDEGFDRIAGINGQATEWVALRRSPESTELRRRRPERRGTLRAGVERPT